MARPDPSGLVNEWRGVRVVLSFDPRSGPLQSRRRTWAELEAAEEAEEAFAFGSLPALGKPPKIQEVNDLARGGSSKVAKSALDAELVQDTKAAEQTAPAAAPKSAQPGAAPKRAQPGAAPKSAQPGAEQQIAQAAKAAPAAVKAEKTAKVGQPLDRRVLPWENFEPRSLDDLVGIAQLSPRVLNWLRQPARACTLLTAALVLHGPPGVGKSALCRLAIAEAGFALMYYGADMEIPLPQFLRGIGAVNCDGRRTCLLVDELQHVLDLPSNATASGMRVHCPVLATTDFVPKRELGRYGEVLAVPPLHNRDMVELLSKHIHPRLQLPMDAWSPLVERSGGDGRQLCVNACFYGTARDTSVSPFDWARAALTHRASPKQEPGGFELLICQQNFASIPNLPLEFALNFAEQLAFMDNIPEEYQMALLPLAIQAKGGYHLQPRIPLQHYAGFEARRQRSNRLRKLQQEQQEQLWGKGDAPPSRYSLRQLALRQFR